MALAQEFKTSPGEVLKLRRMVAALKIAAVAAALLCIPAAIPYGPVGWVAGGAAALALVLLAWRFKADAWLQQLSKRVLRVQAQALEISKGKFTRFILFDDVLLLRVQRRKDDSITAIILVTQEGPLVIRGFEEMEIIFGHVSTRKPEEALIQIESTPWF
jgi:hypothetical protein